VRGAVLTRWARADSPFSKIQATQGSEGEGVAGVEERVESEGATEGE